MSTEVKYESPEVYEGENVKVFACAGNTCNGRKFTPYVEDEEIAAA
jgi:hypothetical protein